MEANGRWTVMASLDCMLILSRTRMRTRKRKRTTQRSFRVAEVRGYTGGIPGGKKTRYSTTTRINTGDFVGFRCYNTRYKAIQKVLQSSKERVFAAVKARVKLQQKNSSLATEGNEENEEQTGQTGEFVLATGGNEENEEQ